MADFPKVGDAMPDVAMTLSDGTPVRVGDYHGTKLVIFFYPKDDTPGCTTENKDFTALADEFAGAGVALLGVSKDSVEKHRKFADKHALSVSLASDAGEAGLSDALGIWTEKVNYGRTYMGMIRTTYLVDSNGAIAQIWPKVKVAGHAAAVLAAARALNG